jgi:hypothetical protein
MFWTPMKKIFCGLLVVAVLAAVVLVVVVAVMADGGNGEVEVEFKRFVNKFNVINCKKVARNDNIFHF